MKCSLYGREEICYRTSQVRLIEERSEEISKGISNRSLVAPSSLCRDEDSLDTLRDDDFIRRLSRDDLKLNFKVFFNLAFSKVN
jgi:hypothetical protein